MAVLKHFLTSKAGVTTGLLFLLMGCSPEENDDTYQIDEYFDVVGLINEEVAYYEKNPPETIRKTVEIQNESETREKALDSLKDIQSIMTTADINKPALKGIYSTDTSVEALGSDTFYTTIQHTLKPEEDELVNLIKVYYEGSPKKKHLNKVLIHKNRSNLLYRNAQYVLLNFEAEHLSQLVLEGTQQILFFEPHRFRTRFELERNN